MIKDNHTKWANDLDNSPRYKKDIAKMIICFENEPSEINKNKFDMRFIFKKKSMAKFIYPIVKEFFYEHYLTDDIIEWFVKVNHQDYTGSFFGSLFEIYIKRKLIKKSISSLKFDQNLQFPCGQVFNSVLRYTGKGGPNIEFDLTSRDPNLTTSGGYFLYPSQENFPVYDLVYKDFDSHVYCIVIRCFKLKGGSFDGKRHVLSPARVKSAHPIDKLCKHYKHYQKKLGNFFKFRKI